MINVIKRCSFLTHNCLYQLPIRNRIATSMWTRKIDGFRILSTSSSTPIHEANTCDNEDDDRIKLIKLEIAVIRESGGCVPDINSIQKHNRDELVLLKTKTARQHYYKYLLSKEQAKSKEKWQKGQRTRLALEPSQPLGKSTFLLRIERKTINSWRNNRQYGEKLIFDCSYDDHMTVTEAEYAAGQLVRSFSDNRRNREPFDLHFCNVNFDSVTMKNLERRIPTMRNQGFPMNLHECSYLDVFPHEQLVYLTPHCDNDLTEYDPCMSYIVGALVDRQMQKPLSFDRAKEFNLKMARLPLDRYLSWGKGFRKCLKLDDMVRIMLDLKRTRKWEVALQRVPNAKLK